MKIILNDYVPHLGEAGDRVEVRPGYARNYLIPKKLAFEATPENAKTYENNLKQRARKIANMIKAAEANGWIDGRRAALEVLTSIRRAGADIILTYFAKDVVRELQSG